MGPRIREDTGGGIGDGWGRRFGVRKRGWVPASARTRTVGGRATARDVASGYGGGDGSPHPRGHGRWRDGRRLGTALRGTGEGMGPRIREDTGGDGRRLGTSLRGTGEGMGPRIREDKGGGDGRRLGTSLRGTGEGMGPRIREDTEGEGRATAGDVASGYGRGDGSPHPRGHGWRGGRRRGTVLRGTEEGMGPRIREDTGGGTGDGWGRRFGVRERGWVPASARTRTVGGRATARDVASGYGRGDGSPHPRGHGWGDGRRLGTSLRGTGEGVGPRIREDTDGGGMGDGWGRRFGVRERGWVPASARKPTVGDGRWPGTALRDKGEGMGPHIREETDGGGRATAGDVASGYGRGGGSPHPRGNRRWGTGDGWGRRFGVRERGWVPASARTRTVGGRATAGDVASGYGRGDGSPHPRGHGGGRATARDVASGYGRGDGSPHPRGHGGGRATARDVASGYGRGDGSPHPRGHGGGRAAARDVASGYGRGDGSPHPRGHGGVVVWVVQIWHSVSGRYKRVWVGGRT